ncbi:hypothetical protein [Marinobacter salarius]|jgi:hypothetical protein|uniref:hypothetical protein n=1 Tax=Marinobacter salarius TaxID=1420917 RepID=UPI003007FF2B
MFYDSTIGRYSLFLGSVFVMEMASVRWLICTFILLLPAVSSAEDVNCWGSVLMVMDYPERCGGNTAFKTTRSHGKWICPPSDKGNVIVLAALAAGKRLEVYIDSKNGAFGCGSLNHYVKARYVIVKG